MNARDPALLRRTFDTAAERYDRVRPGYPSAVFDDLVALGELEGGSRILEIGCGTGQATLPLAERGYAITAVELGADLAAIARRKLEDYPGVDVVVGAFEDWPVPAQTFDAVVSATAFHWIDPEIRLSKAAQALRPGGTLAIIETRHRPLAEEKLLGELTRCHERWDSAARPSHRHPEDEPPESWAELDGSERFDRVESRRYEWTREYSTAGYIELLLTYSDILVLEPEQQSGLLGCIGDLIDSELGGRIGESTVNHLVVARKR